jgi:hypothetical protein
MLSVAVVDRIILSESYLKHEEEASSLLGCESL